MSACDRCGKPARFQVILPSGGQLALCGHHLNDNRNKLDEIRAAFIPCGGFITTSL